MEGLYPALGALRPASALMLLLLQLPLLLLLLPPSSAIAAESAGSASSGAAEGQAQVTPKPPALSFPDLESLQQFAIGGTSAAFPLKAFRAAKELFLLLQQQAHHQQKHQQAEQRHRLRWPAEGAPSHSAPQGTPPPSPPRFSIEKIPRYILGGVSELHFGCRLYSSSSGSSSISALLCTGRSPPEERFIEASFAFQLPPTAGGATAPGTAAKAAAVTTAGGPAPEDLLCKIGLEGPGWAGLHDVAYLRGALGLCGAFGFRRQVYIHPNVSFFHFVPELSPYNITHLGFKVTPSRYLPYLASAPVAAVNPNPYDEAAYSRASGEEAQQRGEQITKQAAVGDLIPMGPLSEMFWRGIRVDPGPYHEAISIIKAGLAKAVLTTGSSALTPDNCSLKLGFKPQDFAAFEAVGASACSPEAPLLQCSQQLHQLPWSVETQKLADILLLQLEPLVPRVEGQAQRMLHLLTRPGIWLLLQRLLGGPAAARGETEEQRKWYEGEMQQVSPRNYKSYPYNMMGKHRGVLRSEVLRFATLFLDLLPSKTYWQSLQLGCLPEAMGLAAALGSVFEREAPEAPVLLEAAAAAAVEGESGDGSQKKDEKTSSEEQHGQAAASLLQAEAGDRESPQGEGNPLAAYAAQHEAAATAAGQQLASGLLVKPLQPSYEYKDLKALADASAGDEAATPADPTAVATAAAAARRLWLDSPAFSGVPFIIRGVPARRGETYDLEILCSSKGSFPVSRGLVGWFSPYLCEPAYEPPGLLISSSSRSSSKKPSRRLIGMEFEPGSPHRCGVSFLGNEEEKSETDVRGRVLLDLFLGFCWLHGFRAAWILDSVTDIYTNEAMRYTMGVEMGKSFYEHKGFLFSIDTLKKRSRPEACLGFLDTPAITSPSMGGGLVPALCQVRRDLLQTPGFEPTVLYPLHAKAFETLHQLSFDCRAAAWQGCSSSSSSSGGEAPFPLLQQQPDGKCAFELHPLWQDLAAANPEDCGLGKRVGACHAFVRKHWGCKARHKKGCEYLDFLYRAFIYPGANPSQKIPLLISQRWNAVARELAMHHQLQPRQMLLELLQQELADCSATSSGAEGGSRELMQQLHQQKISCDELQREGKVLKEMLQHSVLFMDLSGLPQFWVSNEKEVISNKEEQQATKEDKYCPVAFAWSFITRMQGQLYRHRSFVLPPFLSHTAAIRRHHEHTQQAEKE